MRLKPILFNAEMVRALLEGRKTVTRRVVKPQPPAASTVSKIGKAYGWSRGKDSQPKYLMKQPYQTGDVLWVRETFRVDYLSSIVGSGRVRYKADGSYADIHFSADRYDMMRRAHRMVWRSSENMPREAARIFLRVTGVRVERLQAITEQDAKDEGACKVYPDTDPETGKTTYMQDENATYIGGFVCAWDSTIKSADRATCGWEANPWVWVIEFERVEKPAKNDLDGENP